jgi:signal transduction histidine kinase
MAAMEHVETNRPSSSSDPAGFLAAAQRTDTPDSGDRLDDDLRAANLVQLHNAFIQAVIHGLRGPLNAISLRLDLLGRSIEEDDPSDPTARRLQRDCVDRIRTVLSELSESLPEAVAVPGLESVGGTPFDLVELLREVSVVIRHEALVRNLRVVAELPSEPAWVAADPGRIRQAVLNLVLNAFDSMPNGGRMDLTAEIEPGRVRVRVDDEGHGISPEQQPLLFERHVTHRKGTAGIGLYVSRRIADEAGGTIRVENRIEGGVRAELELPTTTQEAKRADRAPR